MQTRARFNHRARVEKGELARHPRPRRAEQILRHQAARGRLLIPHHHQHDELQLLDRQRRPGSGERALQYDLPRLRREDARLLERDQETAAFRIQLGELARNPTTKEEIARSGRSSVSGLMMTYPVHQAADVLFCKADLVPVGKDQLPHLELTRSIARRFNDRYCQVFPLPDALLSDTPLLLGLDGRKMGKSLGNGISLHDGADDVVAKVRAARTDSERYITFDPDRRPEVANLLRIAGLCARRDPGELAEHITASTTTSGHPTGRGSHSKVGRPT